MFVFNPKTKQFEHQKRVLEETWDKPGYAWWWEQGTGKSKEFLDNAALLYCEKAIGGAVLMAPNGLHRNFITKEVPKHLQDDLAENTATLFWHTAKAKTKRWKNQAREWMEHKGFRILGMSYDGVMTEEGRTLLWEFLQSAKLLYGCDESGRIKEPTTKRTVRILGSAPYAPFRRVMTGTPIANAPWDCFTQIKFCQTDFWVPHGLDSPEAMKAQFGVWERTAKRVPAAMMKRAKSLNYYYRTNGIPECLQTKFKVLDGGEALQLIPSLARSDEGSPQFKNLDQLRDILVPIRSRVLKSEAFDLPPKMYTPLEFDLTPKQRDTYEQVQKLGFTLIEGRSCSPSMALTVLLRLQQIACGYIVTDLEEGEEEPTVLPIDPNPRIDLLTELTEDLPHQAIIWARFRPDIDAIMKALAKQGKRAVRYDGAVDDDERAANEDAFHRGDAQFFVSNPAVGGEGLTLNEAKTHIYYSNSFKLIERLQSEDRSHRYGQDQSVNYIDLIARGTVDERIITALQAKYDVAGCVTGDGLRAWLRGDRLL